MNLPRKIVLNRCFPRSRPDNKKEIDKTIQLAQELVDFLNSKAFKYNGLIWPSYVTTAEEGRLTVVAFVFSMFYYFCFSKVCDTTDVCVCFVVVCVKFYSLLCIVMEQICVTDEI